MCNNIDKIENRETASCDNCNCGLIFVTDEMNTKQYTIDHESEFIREKLLRSEEVRIEEEYKSNKKWLDDYKASKENVNKLATDIIGDVIEEREEALEDLKKRIRLYQNAQ